MYCSKCGGQVSDDASFCSRCGTRLQEASQQLEVSSPSGQQQLDFLFNTPGVMEKIARNMVEQTVNEVEEAVRELVDLASRNEEVDHETVSSAIGLYEEVSRFPSSSGRNRFSEDLQVYVDAHNAYHAFLDRWDYPGKDGRSEEYLIEDCRSYVQYGLRGLLVHSGVIPIQAAMRIEGFSGITKYLDIRVMSNLFLYFRVHDLMVPEQYLEIMVNRYGLSFVQRARGVADAAYDDATAES